MDIAATLMPNTQTSDSRAPAECPFDYAPPLSEAPGGFDTVWQAARRDRGCSGRGDDTGVGSEYHHASSPEACWADLKDNYGRQYGDQRVQDARIMSVRHHDLRHQWYPPPVDDDGIFAADAVVIGRVWSSIAARKGE